MKKPKSNGTHIILDLLWCENQDALESFYFKKELLKVIKNNGMTSLKTISHKFREKWYKKSNSYTALILLAESHISIHTFPLESEKMKVAIDIYTCNFSKSNKQGTINISDFFIMLFNPSDIKNKMIFER